jgi:hypothetical protein
MLTDSNRANYRQITQRLVLLTLIISISFSGCGFQARKASFDPRRCMEEVPDDVDGLTIVQGPRTKASIIRDMVPVICNGQVLFNNMKSEDPELNPGAVVFRVVVEYTGEVIAVDVVETGIQSDRFTREVSDFIMDTDFVNWARDIETVFIYPAHFGE